MVTMPPVGPGWTPTYEPYDPLSINQAPEKEAEVAVASTQATTSSSSSWSSWISSYVTWIWDSLTGKAKPDDEAPIPLTPEQRKQIKIIFDDLRKVIAELTDKPPSEEEVEEMKAFDRLYMDLYKTQQASTAYGIKVSAEITQTSRQQLSLHHKTRQQKLDELIAQAQNQKWFRRLEMALAPIQATAAALMLPPGFNIAVFIVGIALAVDNFSDDAAKGALAKWIAKGDDESTEAWTGRLKLASTLISLGISTWKLATGPLGAIVAAGEGIKTVSSIYTERQTDMSKAVVANLDHITRKIGKKPKANVDVMAEMLKKDQAHTNQMSGTIGAENDTIRQLFR